MGAFEASLDSLDLSLRLEMARSRGGGFSRRRMAKHEGSAGNCRARVGKYGGKVWDKYGAGREKYGEMMGRRGIGQWTIDSCQSAREGRRSRRSVDLC